MIAHASPARAHLRRIQRAGRWLRSAVLLATLAVFGAHFAVVYATEGEIDLLVAAVDGALGVLVLAAAFAHVRTLGRERTHHAIVQELVAALDVPRSVEETATTATRLLVETGVGEAAAVAVAHDGENAEDEPINLLLPVAARGYEDGWLEDAPAREAAAIPAEARVERRPSDEPWVPRLPGRGGERPWVATVPLSRGDELLGVLYLASRRPGLLRRQQLLTTIGAVVGAALDAARVQQAAFEQNRALEEQEARRREFLYAIAHELRTPLTSIQTFADLLKPEAAGDPAAELLLTSLSRGVDRLTTLVNDLLDLGRVEETEMRVQISAVDVCAALRNAESILRPSFMSRRQSLEMDLPERPLMVMGDTRALEQITLNLLSNAHRFTPDGGRVTIRARKQGDRVRVDIEDSGPGIAPPDRRAIFQPFYRVRRTDAPEVPGSGLGLAVARRLVELQGGRIWVEPGIDDRGSRFSFELPRVPSPAPKAASRELEPATITAEHGCAPERTASGEEPPVTERDV